MRASNPKTTWLLLLSLCAFIGCKDLPIIDRDKDGVASKDDCNDLEATVYAGAPELCDGLDNNCDGQTDTPDAIDVKSWYSDVDQDGFGDPETLTVSCYAPEGLIADHSDCDDSDPLTHPGAIELCDSKDTDCNSDTQEEGRVVWTKGSEIEDLSDFFTAGTGETPAIYIAENGGTLHFCESTFFANIEVRSDLTIVGKAGATANTLNGGSASTVIHIVGTDTKVHIEGLTLTSGAATEEDALRSPFGGGVSCEGAVELTLQDLIIRNSIAKNGGALGSQGCFITLLNSSLLENEALDKGGAIYQQEGTITLQDVKAIGNLANFDGGAVHIDDGELNVTDSDFRLNESKRGGGISVRQGTLSLIDSEIRQNEATVGGGILLEGFLGPADLSLNGTIVRQNEASSGGGLVLMYDSAANCIGSSESMSGFVKNISDEGGGILILDSTRQLVFESKHCTFGSFEMDEKNSPNDIEYFGGQSYTNFTIDESLVCTTTQCTQQSF